MKRKIFPYLCAVLFVLSMTVFATGATANAASPKAVKSVTVRADKKNITKKTYALEIGKSKSLKTAVSPKRAVRSIRYKSNKPQIVAVSKKGKVTAKEKGTARIQITVTGKNKKKKSTWVKIKAENPAIKSVSVLIDNRNVTGKEYSLERGGWKDLKVNVAPAKAVKNIEYVSSNTQVANIDQNGTVIARNAGTARITVTATNKDNRKKSAWVTIRVTENKPNPQPNPDPTPDPDPEPERKETPIKITIGDTVLDGVIYDTALAEEFKGHFPLTVSMSAYGGREYYGGLGFTPESSGTGQLNFENGDITYCRTNNTMAIFYAQTERPNLTMEVVPIGKVMSDLSVFESLDSREDITFSLAGEETGGDTPEKNRILVAYFSATNTTERLAGFIADGLHSDLYEIVPEIQYTSADLNYGDSQSRTSIEMNDPNARPAISGSVEDMGQYDTVFLGYPIWWGEAPRIVNTFLESYDFSGKTIIPFCTSGSSGIGSSATHLHDLTEGAEWLSGRRFGSSATQNDMMTWVNSLGLETERATID